MDIDHGNAVSPVVDWSPAPSCTTSRWWPRTGACSAFGPSRRWPA